MYRLLAKKQTNKQKNNRKTSVLNHSDQCGQPVILSWDKIATCQAQTGIRGGQTEENITISQTTLILRCFCNNTASLFLLPI